MQFAATQKIKLPHKEYLRLLNGNGNDGKIFVYSKGGLQWNGLLYFLAC